MSSSTDDDSGIEIIQPSTIYLRPDEAPETEIPIKIDITKKFPPTLSVVSLFRPAAGSRVLSPNTTYVLKSYDREQMNSSDGDVENPDTWAEESFTNEKRAYDTLRKFQGHNIARCYGTAWWLRPDEARVNALVFEYIEGCRLGDLDMETKRNYGKMIADNARAAVRPLKDLRVLHGDIREENIIIRPDFSVVLLDFGSCAVDVTDHEWEEIFLDRDMATLNEELHQSEVDIKPPADPQRYYRKAGGYALWNHFVEREPATWREKYYRYVDGAGHRDLRWALKEDIPKKS